MASAYDSQKEKASNNVLFIRVPIDLAPGVFQFHDFKTAPIITFLSSTDRVTKRVCILLCCQAAQREQRLPAGLPGPCRRHCVLRAFEDPHDRSLLFPAALVDRNQALPLAASHHRVSLRFRPSINRVYLPFPIRARLFAPWKRDDLSRHLPPRVLTVETWKLDTEWRSLASLMI